jgi:uncharacterized protein YkwD
MCLPRCSSLFLILALGLLPTSLIGGEAPPAPVDPEPRIGYKLGPQMQVGLVMLGADLQRSAPVELSADEKAVIELTNAERKKVGLPPLVPHDKLMRMARGHSQNMARKQVAGHDLDGKGTSDRGRDVGYPGEVGENVGAGQRGSAEAMRDWLKSKGHRENLLEKMYSEIGVGVADDSRGLRYWTQVFGARHVKVAAKPLTGAPDGSTGNTVLQLDDNEVVFGSALGRWATRKEELPPGPKGSRRLGQRSVWVCDKVHFTQTVEVVPGKDAVKAAGGPKRLLDTCLITYQIENRDKEPRAVGLRVLVDTMVGKNDAPPFAVPGKKGLLTTQADFGTGKDVPEYVQLLERATAADPGFVAHLTLKVGGAVEAPGRFSITQWPGKNFGWEVPVRDMGGNAAVALYWGSVELPVGGRRLVGYAYGQGRAALGPAKAK